MTKHTPAPWKQDEERIVSRNDNMIADCFYSDENQEQDMANARHIVNCVNCHAELLKSLKLAVHAINRKQNYPVNCEDKNTKCSYDIARICDEAISKAESE